MILKTMVDDIKLFSTKTCVAISPNYYEIHLTYDNRGQVVLTWDSLQPELLVDGDFWWEEEEFPEELQKAYGDFWWEEEEFPEELQKAYGDFWWEEEEFPEELQKAWDSLQPELLVDGDFWWEEEEFPEELQKALENTHTELNTSMTISLNPDYIEWIDNQLKQGMYLVELLQKKQWFVAPGYTDKNKYIDELLQHIKELKAY